MKRLARWLNDRRWVANQTPLDDRPYFEITHLIQARDMAQAEFLFEAMTDALGCGGLCGEDRPCPHFRFGGLHQLEQDG